MRKIKIARISNIIDELDKNIEIVQKEVMWLITNVTPVSGELWDALHNCKYLIAELNRDK